MCKIKKMSINEPGTLYAAMKPAVYFNWIIGMSFHVRLDPSGGPSHFCTKLYTVVLIIVDWSMTYIGLTRITELPNHFETQVAIPTLYKVLVWINTCIGVFSPVLVWLQNGRLQDCLRQLVILDDTFEVVLGAPKEYRKQYISLIRRIAAIASVMVIVTTSNITWIMSMADSLLQFSALTFTLHYPILVMLVLDLNFCLYIGYLGKKFRDMNESLLRLAKKSSAPCTSKKIMVNLRTISKITQGGQMTDVNTEELINDNYRVLYEIRKAHLALCKVSRKIDLAFGIQNLLSMGISFVMITGMLYAVYSVGIPTGDWSTGMIINAISTFIWTAIYAFKIWVVSYSCSTVSNEASRTGDVIYELMESKVDKQLQREIQEFGVQMLQNPVRFNACGFFTLDYSFLHGVIGSITTYLVILIQMNK